MSGPEGRRLARVLPPVGWLVHYDQFHQATVVSMSQCLPIGLYSGSSNVELAAAIAGRLGQPLGRRKLERFPDGETHVQIEESIRGRDIYLVQPTGPQVNENLMELLIMIDAFHRASAGRVTAIIPYYGYARQEKKSTGREPITARLVADLISTAGANRVVSIDLHAPAIQGFFNIWMDHLTAVPLLVDYLKSRAWKNGVIVSPDTGRVKLADQYARALGLPLVILFKRRLGPKQAEVGGVVGSVQGRRPIIIDDMISTGVTVDRAVRTLLAAGALPEVLVAVTHGLFVDEAARRLKQPAIREIVVTDTLPLPRDKQAALGKVTVVSVAPLLAETIRRLNRDESISALFTSYPDHHPV